MNFSITNRRSGKVQVEAQIDCADDTLASVKLGLAVEWAVKAGACLIDADLRGASLARADLAGAYLAGANLSLANLARTNLTNAYLARTDLTSAYMARANLTDAYLAGANLTDADLTGANLSRSRLDGADLTRAELINANLAEAHLIGAKWTDGTPITRLPLQISGLRYRRVIILDAHAQVGCRLLSLAQWEALPEDQVRRIDGYDGLEFWRVWRDPLLALARADGRSFEPIPPEVKE